MSEITFCVLPDEYYKKDVYFKLKHESLYYQKCVECHRVFALLQYYKYKSEKHIEELEDLIENTKKHCYQNSHSSSFAGYNILQLPFYYRAQRMELNTVLEFLDNITHRIKKHKRIFIKKQRRITSIFGSYRDSLSPMMIHKIVSWLKKIDPDKYKHIKYSNKEILLEKLSELDTKIDAELCCKFINDVNPMPFLKEFNVNCYKNGKKQSYSKLRDLLKNEFYYRERNYLRQISTKPFLRGLPKTIEDIIYSFL